MKETIKSAHVTCVTSSVTRIIQQQKSVFKRNIFNAVPFFLAFFQQTANTAHTHSSQYFSIYNTFLCVQFKRITKRLMRETAKLI